MATKKKKSSSSSKTTTTTTTTTKKTTKKTTNSPKYISTSKPKAVEDYKTTTKAPKYKSTAKAPATYTPGTYNSEYADRLNAALDTVTNWQYDPLQDASYQALAKVYNAQGNLAAQTSLADAAALNGGYGTSNAVTAAAQARNTYNQQLMSLLPDLEAQAYNRASGTLSALREADDTAYGRFRDTEGDRQWKYGMDYQAYRDLVGDEQWKYGMDYEKWRDTEADNQWKYAQKYNAYRDAMGDYQWGLNYNLDVGNYLMDYEQHQMTMKAAQQAAAKKSGGGSGRRSGGGGYSSGSSSSSSSGMPISESDFNALSNKTKTAPYTTQNSNNTKYTPLDTARAITDVAKYTVNYKKKK